MHVRAELNVPVTQCTLQLRVRPTVLRRTVWIVPRVDHNSAQLIEQRREVRRCTLAVAPRVHWVQHLCCGHGRRHVAVKRARSFMASCWLHDRPHHRVRVQRAITRCDRSPHVAPLPMVDPEPFLCPTLRRACLPSRALLAVSCLCGMRPCVCERSSHCAALMSETHHARVPTSVCLRNFAQCERHEMVQFRSWQWLV
jgi:hypothetical protein